MKDKALKFLAKNPWGTIIKVGLSSGVVWALENITAFNLNPGLQALAVAALTMAANALNPHDLRYGRKVAE